MIVKIKDFYLVINIFLLSLIHFKEILINFNNFEIINFAIIRSFLEILYILILLLYIYYIFIRKINH